MIVDPWIWQVSIAAIALVILGDLIYQIRKPHEPTFKESAIQSVIYIGLALLFTVVIAEVWGSGFGGEYLAGFITEKSLSVDNLFVFLVIFTKFAVPRRLQSQALLIGIVLALILRGIFIAAGAAAIERFSWVFYIFGFFLLYTAVLLIWDTLKSGSHEEKVPGGKATAYIKRHFPTVDEYHGSKLTILQNGKRYITPLMLVMIAIGLTDLLFALDSIPAVYGLTKEPYIVFMANAFALMGLRQLYFLLGGLLDKLEYLKYGIAAILGFIGFKLVAHAMHVNELPFINGGQHIEWAPEIPTEASLGVIVAAIVISAVVSLVKARNKTN